MSQSIFKSGFFSSKKTEILIPYYENFLQEKGEYSRNHRGYLHFHPSAYGGCLRKMAFQYHGETDERFRVDVPVDLKFQRICDSGHAYHHRMQRDLAVMGVLRGWWRCKSCNLILGKEDPLGIFLPEKCDCQKKEDKRKGIDLFEYEEIYLVSDSKYNFKGNCDGIIEIEKGNPDSRYVIDFKSISENGFSYLNKPDHKYVVQINIYMWLTGIKKGIIFYEEKNRHNMVEFLEKYDEKLIDYIKKSSSRLKIICESGKIPTIPKDYKKDEKPCTAFGKKCEYFEHCYGPGKI
jgi:hypothetical protein